MSTDPKRETLFYRVRGGLTGVRGVSNECRAIRGVTSLRDRGFRTFRNAREPRPNTHDEKLMDLMSFVNTAFPEVKELPLVMQTLALFEGTAHPSVALHVQAVCAHTHDAVTFELGPTSGVEPPYSPRYIRGLVLDSSVTDETQDSLDELIPLGA